MKGYVTALMLVTTPAFAVDLSTKLIDLDGRPATECVRLTPDRKNCEEEVALTVGWVARFALDLPEDKLSASDIIRRGNLSEKIKAKDVMEFSVDEAKLVKDQISKLGLKTNLKFQVIKLIDPKSIDDAK